MTKMEAKRENLRREMRELWERDRRLWLATLPYAAKRLIGGDLDQ